MSFAFNFPNPEGNDKTGVENPSNNSETKEEQDDVEMFREILLSDIVMEEDLSRQTFQLAQDVCIQCIDSQAVERRLCDNQGSSCSVVKAAKQHSDLIPNVYEGGLKVWECAIDLIEFLQKCDTDFCNKTVLELGCGAGLPGILSMMKGAACVHFQDYNHEVLENYTIPNVMLNTPDKYTCTCRYFSGDWGNLREHMANQNIQYDVILTAETIYKPENYRKLTAIFETFLSDRGEIFVAAKSNYFGVGGGTRDFESFINKTARFRIETCYTIDAGVPREIMKLKWMT